METLSAAESVAVAAIGAPRWSSTTLSANTPSGTAAPPSETWNACAAGYGGDLRQWDTGNEMRHQTGYGRCRPNRKHTLAGS